MQRGVLSRTLANSHQERKQPYKTRISLSLFEYNSIEITTEPFTPINNCSFLDPSGGSFGSTLDAFGTKDDLAWLQLLRGIRTLVR